MKRNILFFPDKKKDSTEGNLRLRIRWEGNTAQFNVGLKVTISKWNKDAQRCKANTSHGEKLIPASLINKKIQHLEDVAESIFNAYEQKGAIPTTEQFKNEFNNKLGKAIKKKDDIFTHYAEFIRSESKESGWTIATIKKHNTIKNHLQAFAPRLEYADFTEKGLNMFVDYLLSLPSKDDNTMRNTTIKKDINILKWFLRWATRKGYNTSTAFLTFKPKLKTIPKKVIFLEWKELMQIYNTTIPEEKKYLQRVKDKFLFCCFTSLRYSDMEALTWSNVHDEYLDVVTIKTNDPIRIELNDYSKEILAKYPRKDEYVFPPITNQRMNEYIKELGQLAGIDTPITITFYCGNERIEETHPKYELMSSHTARRTFICNALMLGIAPNIVMKWTGHSDYNAMKPYIEIADNAKKKAMSLFNK